MKDYRKIIDTLRSGKRSRDNTILKYRAIIHELRAELKEARRIRPKYFNYKKEDVYKLAVEQGLKKYQSSHPCNKCADTWRYITSTKGVLGTQCVTCQKKYSLANIKKNNYKNQRKWNKAHPEVGRAQSKKYFGTEKGHAYNSERSRRRWWAMTPEERHAQNQRQYQRRKEKLKGDDK